jgi:hypothetical protein
MQLTATHHAMLDQAAALLGPSTRARFMLHVRARIDGSRDLTDSALVNVLLGVLGDFGVSVGPQFFQQQNPRSRGNHAGELAEAARRA